MEILKDKYTITELSQRLGITDHALRFYEKEFSLTVPKDSRGRRFYTPDLANIMFQIKTMRDDGLEIKAIKKILSEDNSGNPPPVVLDDDAASLIPISTPLDTSREIKQFFNEFREQLTDSFTCELTIAREQLAREIEKSKFELGACVENSVRKLETKMERHFLEVDRSIGDWRERNRPRGLGRFFRKIFK